MKRSDMIYELSIRENIPDSLTRKELDSILKVIEELGMLPPPIESSYKQIGFNFYRENNYWEEE